MRDRGTATVKLSEVEMKLFVRAELDHDRVMYLAGLIEHGTEMRDMIELGYTKADHTRRMVDGRHRKEAYELNRIDTVEVRILEFEDDAEMIGYAYQKNTGGPKPPTVADTEHTVKLLLDCKESVKRIAERLGFPAGLARTYVKNVQSRMNRAKLQRAADAVTDDGLTVAKAADMHGVDPDKLKEVLSNHKRKNTSDFMDLHRNLTKLYNGMSRRNGAAIRKLIDGFEDGDVTEKQVREILGHIENLQRRAAKIVSDLKKRFDARVGVKKAERKATKVA